MVDTVRDPSVVLKALKQALQTDVRTKDMVVKCMEVANTNPDLAKRGWVSLYADADEYTPRTAGAGRGNWNWNPTLRAIVQASDLSSGEGTLEKLGVYLKAVVDVVLANKTLAEHVEALTNIRVEYAIREDDAKSLHFIGALVTMQFDGRSN
ncbi:MAG TPA: hypothetical protein VF161_06280 [Steroidobacteraceae bacterium]